MADDAKLIERFNPSLTCGWADMAQDPEGDYVTYEDHAARLTALTEENERLRGALREADELAEAITFNREPLLANLAERVRCSIRAALSGDEGGV